MNLAQELYLCALDGSPYHGQKLPPGIGGALLADLQLQRRVELGERVRVLDRTPTGDPLLDQILGSLPEGEDSPEIKYAVSGVGQVQTGRVMEKTLEDGLCAEHAGEKRRLLPGSKPAFKLATPAGEEPRARAREALLGQREPDARTAVLVTLVEACGLVDGLVSRDERKAARERAREIANGEGVSEVVRGVIRNVRASIASQIDAATPN